MFFIYIVIGHFYVGNSFYYKASFFTTNSSINLTVSSIPNTEESMQR